MGTDTHKLTCKCGHAVGNDPYHYVEDNGELVAGPWCDRCLPAEYREAVKRKILEMFGVTRGHT